SEILTKLKHHRFLNPPSMNDSQSAKSSNQFATEKNERSRLAETAELRRILDAATHVCIIRMNTDGHVLDFNAGAELMLGYTADEIIGHPMEAFHLESEVVAFRQEMFEKFHQEFPGFSVFVISARQGGCDDREWTFVCRDGTHLFVKLTVTAIRDCRGVTEEFLAVATDITKQVRTEQRLRNVVEATPSGMVMANPRGRITLVNRAAEAMFGYSRLELIGEPIDRLIPVAIDSELAFNRSPPSEPNDQTIAPARIVTGIRRDGTQFPVEVTLSPIDAAGRCDVIIAVIDASERNSAMDSLKESEERFRELAETVHEVFWLIDAKSGRVLYVSPAYDSIWGKSRETLYENPMEWSKAIHPDDQDRVQSLFTASLRTGEFDTDFCLVHADGTNRWIHSRAFPVRAEDGTVIRLVGVSEDITLRKKMEQALLTSNEELEAFCYSVSHDLRAPLRHVVGFSQAVIEDYADKLDDEGREMLDMIREATHKMGALIDDLLALSRVSRREMQIEEINLTQMFADIVDELKGNYSNRHLSFSVADRMVTLGDRRMLRLALFNLLDNAVKYSALKDPAMIEFGSSSSTTGPVFFVRDNGTGFDEKYCNKLFVPFQRLHRDEEFAGTGIGLAIVKRVVNRHGGRVWAEGVKGQGAIFSFTIGRELRLNATAHKDSLPRKAKV
ncbi:MAG TPA: PAS domain S-box protein, partial [Schlesneria sp.]